MLKKIPIIISFAILGLIVWLAEPGKLIETASEADAALLAAAVAVSTVSLSCRVLRWEVLVRTGFFQLFPIQMLGMAISNFTPGKIAEPAKAVLLKMKKGTAVSEALASIVWERIFDLIVLLILAIFGVQLALANREFLIFGIFGVALVAAVVAIAILALHIKSFGLKIFRIAKKLPVLRRISDDFVNTFYETKFRKRALAASLLITAAAWMLDAVVLKLVLASLGVDSDIILLAGIIALSAILGIASSLPGGLGSTEVVMALLLGITGVPATTAVAGMLLTRFASFWYNALLGAASFVHLSKKIDIWAVLKAK